MSLEERWQKALAHVAERPFWRAPQEADFISNDYLALQADGIISAILKEVDSTLWRGAGASRYLGGDHPIYAQLEALLSKRYGGEALLFQSGLVANLSLWEAIAQRGDTILYDREVHASIRQGIRLSFAKSWGFRHNSWEEAEKRLRQATGEVFLVVESLYSMQGDAPDPIALRELQARYGCHLVIDEAHTTLLYPGGVSWFQQQGLSPLVCLLTFGKAVGLMGAAVVTTPLLREYLRRRAFGAIYSTALPPLIVAAVYEVFARVRAWEARQLRLQQLIAYFRQLLEARGIPYTGLVGPICMVSRAPRGFHLKRLEPPTVPQPAYRISLHANHPETLLEKLANALAEG